MKAKWLDRLALKLPYFTLATSQQIFEQELKRLKIPSFQGVLPGAHATVHFMQNEEKDTCAIVCVFNHQKVEKLQVYSLLTHEAVHIFQNVMENIDEKNPGDEVQAYIIQKISQSLFYEFDRQTKPKSTRTTRHKKI